MDDDDDTVGGSVPKGTTVQHSPAASDDIFSDDDSPARTAAAPSATPAAATSVAAAQSAPAIPGDGDSAAQTLHAETFKLLAARACWPSPVLVGLGVTTEAGFMVVFPVVAIEVQWEHSSGSNCLAGLERSPSAELPLPDAGPDGSSARPPDSRGGAQPSDAAEEARRARARKVSLTATAVPCCGRYMHPAFCFAPALPPACCIILNVS